MVFTAPALITLISVDTKISPKTFYALMRSIAGPQAASLSSTRSKLRSRWLTMVSPSAASPATYAQCMPNPIWR
jgi:hypothetical protein